MNKQDLDIVHWAAAEVHHQLAGPLYVPRLVQAYLYARSSVSSLLVEEDIKVINALVLGKEEVEYRLTPVVFMSGGQGVDYREVPRLMKNLLRAQVDLDVDSFCKELLDIHPFEDGNGRTAAVIYNLLKGFPAPPCALPDFYN